MMRLAPAFALSRGTPVTFRHASARSAIRMLSAAAPGPKVRRKVKILSDHFWRMSSGGKVCGQRSTACKD